MSQATQTRTGAASAASTRLPIVPRPAGALVGGGLSALLSTLVFAVDEIDIQRVYGGELNEQGAHLLKLAEHAVRTLFNVLRSCSAQPDQQAEVLKVRASASPASRAAAAGALTSPARRRPSRSSSRATPTAPR